MALPTPLFRKIKEAAARHGKTFQECLSELVALGLKAQAAPRGRGGSKLPSYPLGPFLIDPADRAAAFELLRRP